MFFFQDDILKINTSITILPVDEATAPKRIAGITMKKHPKEAANDSI